MTSGIYIKGTALCHMDSVTSVSPDVSAECHAERRCEWVVSESGGTPELIKVKNSPTLLHMSHV